MSPVQPSGEKTGSLQRAEKKVKEEVTGGLKWLEKRRTKTEELDEEYSCSLIFILFYFF